MKKYENNAILVINNKCILPNGWLEMFINDHKKYPNDAIIASIQYYFNKKGEIKEFLEGYKGEKFGIFNHVTDMLFNFAIVNSDLGGILYPKHFFQNKFFYKQDLYLNLSKNSDEFWQSAFIIMEDKILRQSSKIFDYTKYIINYINYKEYFHNKINLFEKIKLSFLNYFPKFNESLIKRQNKIIVSLTSYPKRFLYLTDLMKFIRNQNYTINRTIIFIYKDDIPYLNLSLTNVEIIKTDMDLKPHKKYFYPMKLFRDYAIITLDDDFGYSSDTFESLVNAYLENPNLISGRRAHLMTYKNNGELKRYLQWKFEYKSIKEPNFDLTLTGNAGIIYPPDILNINDNYLPIIKETITCDDLTLKYYETIKGIPIKWIVSNKINGVFRRLPKSTSAPLFNINLINNDICIKKLNIIINKTTLNNLCVFYRDIQTGKSIYLFDIYDEKKINNKLTFNINCYSYCPMEKPLKFNIIFGDYIANCFSNKLKLNFTNEYFKEKDYVSASCIINKFDLNLNFINNYYFPIANSTNNLFINIYNYKIYLTNIYKNFVCQNSNNCVLTTILLEKDKLYNFSISINDKHYICNLIEKNNNSVLIYPKIQEYHCNLLRFLFYKTKTYISGLPFGRIIKSYKNNLIPKQFIISRIAIENEKNNKNIIIIGRINEDLNQDFYNFSVTFLFPRYSLQCSLKPNSKYVQSIIYCINNEEINSKILIENQIVTSFEKNEEILLINEITLTRLYFNKNNDIMKSNCNLILMDDLFYINIYIMYIHNLIIYKIKNYIN